MILKSIFRNTYYNKNFRIPIVVLFVFLEKTGITSVYLLVDISTICLIRIQLGLIPAGVYLTFVCFTIQIFSELLLDCPQRIQEHQEE